MKAQHVAKNTHYQIAHTLCRKYKNLIFPDFNVQSCVKKEGRSINKQVTKRAQFWRFGKLKSRLIEVASFYNTKVYTGSEAYTSKTCGHCGTLAKDLGRKEVFDCSKCHWHGDRDVHAARNILLRFLK